MKKLFLLLAPFLLLGACDPISEDQCRSGDWAGIGLADGKKGRSAATLDQYTEICGALGITPVRSIYLAARAQGLLSYCTPSSAYDIGRRGDRINPVCTAEQDRAMLPAYNRGRAYFQLEEVLDELKAEIDELKKVQASFPDTLDESQRAELLQIRRRLNRLDDKLFDLERDQRDYAFWP